MSPRKLTHCIFCGSPNVTAEHIFSRWTHKYMGPREKGKAKSRQSITSVHGSEEKIIKLPGQMRDWKVWCVCGGTHKSCNGGWMKSIEDAAKPVMKTLIEGKELRIFPADQEKIATWAVLKALVSEFDTQRKGKPCLVHHKHKKYLMDHRRAPSKGWGVWIGHFDRKEWIPEWVSRPMLLLPDNVAAKRLSRKATYFNTNCITQTVGKLFIVVIHSPMPTLIPRWRFATPEGGMLFRIWPRSDASLKWPGAPMSDHDADYAADALASLVREGALRRARENLTAGRPHDA